MTSASNSSDAQSQGAQPPDAYQPGKPSSSPRPSPHDPDTLRLFAVELAQLGGRTAERLFGKVTVTRKADNSPVTEADHITQEAILRALAERYPDHAILVEETIADPSRHAKQSASDFCWVVDPIDGTRNFARGVRVFATSVALLHYGRPIASAVFDATSGSIYSAALGHGAFRDETPLSSTSPMSVPSPSTPTHATPPGVRSLSLPALDRDTTIGVGSFRRNPMPDFVRDWMSRYLMRNLGSTSLHFTWIAAGLLDAAYTNECKIWDIAAPALILEESGVRLTTDSGATLWPFAAESYTGTDLTLLAAHPSVHAKLLGDMHSTK